MTLAMCQFTSPQVLRPLQGHQHPRHPLSGPIRDQILARPETAPVIIRPDSGDPHSIPPKVLSMLAGYFGTTETDKGYALCSTRAYA